MRHLFIINPVAHAVKGELNTIIKSIHEFFRNSVLNEPYDIHVTRWERDAKGYLRRYADNNPDEVLRVHSMGGSGTLFEVVNGIHGLTGAELAAYPMGRDNSFLRYFGDKMHMFSSIQLQSSSGTAPFDIFRCGYNYGILCGLVGMEAIVSRDGELLNRRRRLPAGFGYILAAVKYVLGKVNCHKYTPSRLTGKHCMVIISQS